MPRGGAAKQRRSKPPKKGKPITEGGPANLLKAGTKRPTFDASQNSFLKGVKTYA